MKVVLLNFLLKNLAAKSDEVADALQDFDGVCYESLAINISDPRYPRGSL